MAQTMTWKRLTAVLTATIFILSLSGCASVQRKFTRKPKQPKHVAKAIAFEEGPHQKKFSNEYYYKSHYTYWKAWHGEWIDGLGGGALGGILSNHKKTARNAQETLSNLEQMRDYLQPEKAKELDEPIHLLKRMREQVERGQSSGTGQMRVELERWRRIISSNFYYEKVKDQLLSDAVDLGDSAPPPATPAEAQEPAAPAA